MDQYLDQIDNIINDEKTSSTMCLKLKEILDLRQVNTITEKSIRIILWFMQIKCKVY